MREALDEEAPEPQIVACGEGTEEKVPEKAQASEGAAEAPNAAEQAEEDTPEERTEEEPDEASENETEDEETEENSMPAAGFSEDLVRVLLPEDLKPAQQPVSLKKRLRILLILLTIFSIISMVLYAIIRKPWMLIILLAVLAGYIVCCITITRNDKKKE